MGRGQAGPWARKLREHLLSLILCGMKLCIPMASWSLLSPKDAETLQRHLHLATYFCHYLMTYLHAAPCREFPPKPYTVISLHHKLKLLFAVSNRGSFLTSSCLFLSPLFFFFFFFFRKKNSLLVIVCCTTMLALNSFCCEVRSS